MAKIRLNRILAKGAILHLRETLSAIDKQNRIIPIWMI